MRIVDDLETDGRTDRKLIGALRVYTNTLKNHVTEMSRAIPRALVQFSWKVFKYLSPSFLLKSPRFLTISFDSGHPFF